MDQNQADATEAAMKAAAVGLLKAVLTGQAKLQIKPLDGGGWTVALLIPATVPIGPLVELLLD